jgi:hypothetical protein
MILPYSSSQSRSARFRLIVMAMAANRVIAAQQDTH